MKKRMSPSFLSKRGKLGAFSFLAMLAVLVIAGLSIAASDKLENKYALRIDNSFNSVTSKSLQTEQILSNLETNVHVYALFTPGQEDKALIGLLERYAAASQHFSFSIENLLANPTLIHHISSNLDDAAVSTDCLIVHGKEMDRTRILNVRDYITQGYDMQSGQFYVSGLSYEQSLTEAVMFVTAPNLASIQVLSGHGELDKEDMASMLSLLTKYNYELREVNLLHGDSLNPQELLMVLSPSKDISSKQLDDITSFSRAGGALFITSNFGIYEDMPNFEALFRNLGFIQKPGLVVTMEEENESYYSSPAVLMPYMELSEPTASMMEKKQTTLILAGSAAFYEPEKINPELTQYVVLRSGNAYLRDTSDQSDNIDQRPGDETGKFPLALVSERLNEDGTRSKNFIIGNTSVFTDSWLYQNTYSAEFLLNLVQYLSPIKAPSIMIAPKDAIRPPLRVTSFMLNYLLLIILPLSVSIVALMILTPRKKR